MMRATSKLTDWCKDHPADATCVRLAAELRKLEMGIQTANPESHRLHGCCDPSSKLHDGPTVMVNPPSIVKPRPDNYTPVE